MVKGFNEWINEAFVEWDEDDERRFAVYGDPEINRLLFRLKLRIEEITKVEMDVRLHARGFEQVYYIAAPLNPPEHPYNPY